MKKKDAVFDETQRLKRWFLLLLLIPVNLIFIAGCVVQIGLSKPWGDNPMSDVGLIITTILFLLFTANMLFISMQTFVDKEGVSVSVWLFPFYRQTKSFLWDDISEVYITKYRPISDYGGWGIRLGFNGTAYNMSGNIALVLLFKNGKKILIGTNNPDELSEVLYQLGKTDEKQYG